MLIEFKRELLKSICKFHRGLYAILIITVLLSGFSGTVISQKFMVYNLCLVASAFFIDELLMHFVDKTTTFYYTVRSFLLVFGIAISIGFIREMPRYMLCIYMIWGLSVVTEDSFMSNIMDEYGIIPRRLALTIIISIGVVLNFWDELEGTWAVGFFFFVAAMVVTSFIDYILISRSIKVYDEKLTGQTLRNDDLIKENEDLKTLQERVEQVNNEINLQKIELTKANKDLEALNRETRSLIDVMKFFSDSYDVEMNANVMVSNIMNIKDPDICTMFIDRNVYGNEEPHREILVSDPSFTKVAADDTKEIFDYIKLRNIIDPLFLCKDNNFMFPYFINIGICNAVAIPAIENGKVYGVLIVASMEERFFDNGLAFYESSVTDFTADLISDRLYLKTVDMAKKDGLTQIYNRYYFNEFYNKLIEDKGHSKNGSLTVAMFDIDFFKNINDTYGHLAGDEVLKNIAGICAEYAERHGGSAVRYGGEEFAIVFSDKNIDESYAILRDLHKDIKNSVINFNGTYIRINVSIGLASYPETNSDINDVLDSADRALYYSKENGRGMIVIYGREEEALNENFSY